ncbi:MAG: hypothetical protein ACFFCQ_16670, partial [Promethearchaeota archaeon]
MYRNVVNSVIISLSLIISLCGTLLLINISSDHFSFDEELIWSTNSDHNGCSLEKIDPFDIISPSNLAVSVDTGRTLGKSDLFARPVVLIDLAHNNLWKDEFTGFITNLTSWGYDVILNDIQIMPELLNYTDILITSAPTHYTENYTENELVYIKEWFDRGNKGIWVAGKSDYETNEWALMCNSLLKTIDSRIYFEPGQVGSDTNIAGQTYRVLANEFN